MGHNEEDTDETDDSQLTRLGSKLNANDNDQNLVHDEKDLMVI